MKKTITTASVGAVLALSAPIMAQDSEPVASSTGAIVLWDTLTTATTKTEFKAYKKQLPKKRVELIPDCIAEMGYRSKKKLLVTVIFLGLDKDADCHRRLLDSMLETLGEPEIGQTTFGSVIGNGMGGAIDTITQGTMLTWREGDKKTKLVKTPSSGYNLIFTVRDDKYLY